MTASRHVRSLLHAAPVYEGALGSARAVTADHFSLLQRMSMQRLVLTAGTIREPHWYANANELAYCVSGELLVSVLDNADLFGSFTIAAGEMFHVPVGSLHTIENIGDGDAELIIVFGHERPEEFSLHAAFGAMTDAVLGNTYTLPASDFASLNRDTGSAVLVRREAPPRVEPSAALPDPHKFGIAGESPPVNLPYGSARVARLQFWPALKDLSMYSVVVKENGMREPHWHPNTAEMGYVHQGRARMSILDPDGSVDTYELEPGDVYFIPRSYPHQIEVLSDEEIHFLVFFDQPTPGDIGYRASTTSIAPDVLAATFGIAPEAAPAWPVTPVDPLIVERVNPVDPVV
ncbi:cupin domain-containing protein [Sphingomonas sp. M1-B02]|uniref:cupin domain-containing protein n=1 Tax=Sphingomonas sp. M1-B02 TaxID=3114300 RepID=UPI00223FAFCE|nr:cupin domain-containing protein [Sphingomonas sp. S6-11]UZK66289.1 cupin domain-containing protein [Sphingomonas sp. S6-11]